MVIGIEITVKFLNKFICDFYGHIIYFLFGFLRHFQHFTGYITMGSFVGRGNQYIQLVKVLYCILPTSGKQLATLPHKVQGLNSQPQRWEASMRQVCKYVYKSCPQGSLAKGSCFFAIGEHFQFRLLSFSLYNVPKHILALTSAYSVWWAYIP